MYLLHVEERPVWQLVNYHILLGDIDFIALHWCVSKRSWWRQHDWWSTAAVIKGIYFTKRWA